MGYLYLFYLALFLVMSDKYFQGMYLELNCLQLHILNFFLSPQSFIITHMLLPALFRALLSIIPFHFHPSISRPRTLSQRPQPDTIQTPHLLIYLWKAM